MVRFLLLLSVFAFQFLQAQTIAECKSRFDRFLNFNGSLSSRVKFEATAIRLLSANGKAEFSIYADEIALLARYFISATPREQAQFIRRKGNNPLGDPGKDSLSKKEKQMGRIGSSGNTALSGARIAIDPGHFGTSLKEAEAERKFLSFALGKSDTIRLFESALNFQTAWILKSKLEEQGAAVFITRREANHTSFGCTYHDWLSRHKVRVLDSLEKAKVMNAAKARSLKKMNAHDFFWNFFRDFELANRAEVINGFSPDLTVIVHYNVDEKNAPWTRLTRKNFTMAFIPGAFMSSDLNKPYNRTHFVRLLLTDQLDRSQKAGEMLVKEFSRNLGITPAEQQDAIYLTQSCKGAGCPGLYCRNLALCRTVNSPLVYGESLYQDNENEARELMKQDLEVSGIRTNSRVNDVAGSYAEAVKGYFVSLQNATDTRKTGK
jgi:N-acetylmuramoyl-L-alanine amidase